MVTELFLIRHGETKWNRELRFQGHADLELNQRGIEQAQITAHFLTEHRFDRFYSSDLKRAGQTAEILAAPHNLPVLSRKDLREINYGDWEGQTYRQLWEQEPQSLEKWSQDPSAIKPPGGETLPDFQLRVVNSFLSLIKESAGKRIVVICHGGTLMVYLAYVLQMPLKLCNRFQFDHLGVSRIILYEQNPIISMLNNTGHLTAAFVP